MSNEEAAQIEDYVPRDLLEEAENQPPNLRSFSTIAIWRKTSISAIVFLLPLVIALAVILWADRGKKCDRPLGPWSTVQFCAYFVLVGLNAFILFRLPRMNAPDRVQSVRYRQVRVAHTFVRLINILCFGWFIVGAIWVFEALSMKCPHTAPNLFKISLAIVVIQMVLYVLIGLFCVCSCCLLFLRFFFHPPMLRGPPPGASQDLIDELKTLKYEPGVIPSDNMTCAICLDDYELGNEIRLLPCNHHFHKDCADRWLKLNKSCPFCKRLIDGSEEPLVLPAPPSNAELPVELVPVQPEAAVPASDDNPAASRSAEEAEEQLAEVV
jgi:hypothetical protein